MKFYDPHDVTVWAPSDASTTGYTTITLIDDGNARPGCDWDDVSLNNCFSRAVEYELNTDTMTAKLLWQFEFPVNAAVSGIEEAEKYDVFNEVGGSVTKLSTDGTYDGFVISFTAVYNDDDTSETDDGSDDGYTTFIYQADSKGDAGAYMSLPPLPQWATAGRYRIVPRASVYGESQTSPFGAIDDGGGKDAALTSNNIASRANSSAVPSPGHAILDDVIDDQMPINVGITDDDKTAAAAAKGASLSSSFQ